MDEHALTLLEQYDNELEELQALVEHLHSKGELRYFGGSDYHALRTVRTAVNREVGAYREGA